MFLILRLVFPVHIPGSCLELDNGGPDAGPSVPLGGLGLGKEDVCAGGPVGREGRPGAV